MAKNADGVWIQTTLHAFNGSDGKYTVDTLTIDAAGNLYGTTQYGGVYGWGTVVELSKSGSVWTLNTLHDFTDGADGGTPEGTVVLNNGNLYGFAGDAGNGSAACISVGNICGTIYEMTNTNGTWTFNTLYAFKGLSGGWTPSGEPIFFNGSLYGVTAYGGTPVNQVGPCNGNGCGVVFQLSPSGNNWTFSTIHKFKGDTTDCGSPVYSGPLVIDAGGNIYGATGGGGTGTGPQCSTYGCGTAYEISPRPTGGWREAVIYNFGDKARTKDGVSPTYEPVMDASGNLYGTTYGEVSTGMARCTSWSGSPLDSGQIQYCIISLFHQLTDINRPLFCCSRAGYWA